MNHKLLHHLLVLSLLAGTVTAVIAPNGKSDETSTTTVTAKSKPNAKTPAAGIDCAHSADCKNAESARSKV